MSKAVVLTLNEKKGLIMNISLANRILQAYIRCITRRRDYVFFGLGDLLLQGKIDVIIKENASKIAGVCGHDYGHGVFVVSHFFAESDRLGAEFLRESAKSRTLIFAVTEDLSPMLEKLGYVFVGHTEQEFNGELVTKMVFVSNTFTGRLFRKWVDEKGFEDAVANFERLRYEGRIFRMIKRLRITDIDE